MIHNERDEPMTVLRLPHALRWLHGRLTRTARKTRVRMTVRCLPTEHRDNLTGLRAGPLDLLYEHSVVVVAELFQDGTRTTPILPRLFYRADWTFYRLRT